MHLSKDDAARFLNIHPDQILEVQDNGTHCTVIAFEWGDSGLSINSTVITPEQVTPSPEVSSIRNQIVKNLHSLYLAGGLSEFDRLRDAMNLIESTTP